MKYYRATALLKRRKGCPFQGRSGGHTWRASSLEAARHQEVAPAGDGFARFGGGGDLFGGHEVVAARIIAAPTSAFARTTERLARLKCCLLPFDFLAARADDGLVKGYDTYVPLCKEVVYICVPDLDTPVIDIAIQFISLGPVRSCLWILD